MSLELEKAMAWARAARCTSTTGGRYLGILAAEIERQRDEVHRLADAYWDLNDYMHRPTTLLGIDVASGPDRSVP